MEHQHHHHHAHHTEPPIEKPLPPVEDTQGHNAHGAHQGGAHDHHAMMIDDFKKRFWISAILSIPVLIFSPMIQDFFGYHWLLPANEYVLLLLSSIIYFYGGWPFLSGLVAELRERAPGMMTLIAMAISVAYFYSAATVFGLAGMDFFWELVTLIDIMLLGHWIEMKSIAGASRSLELLVSMMPAVAHRVRGDEVEEVKLEEVHKDDMLLVKPGEKIPADGIVIEGESYVNESMLTGESKPVKRSKGMKVIGGAVNGNGSLKISVTNSGKDGYLHQVIALVEEAGRAKSRMQNLSDRAARWLTYIALVAGFGTLFTWLLMGYPFVFALERMVTVMVIACPHALGLAVPLVVAISTSIAAQNGLLIRNRTAFEASGKISTILFDKTGTLTKGAFDVTRIETIVTDRTPDALLAMAAALEQHSEHPIGIGIIARAKGKGISVPAAASFQAITGKGVEATVRGERVMVVSPGYLADQGMTIPEGAYGNAAETVVFIIINNQLAGYIALADELRAESKAAVDVLRSHGIKVMMVTGDHQNVAETVSNQLGLDGFYSEVLPHQKADIVKALQAKGAFVAMAGDGVNDAPALAQANVGIAVGSGTDVAAETADIILVNNNPEDIANLIVFGKVTYRKMIQNLVWATAYNVVAIPLAAGVLFASGFVLSPAIGAVTMSLSTVIVAINARLLSRSLGKDRRG